MKNVNFVFTAEQQEEIAKIYGKDASDLQDYELCELLDEVINDAILRQMSMSN